MMHSPFARASLLCGALTLTLVLLAQQTGDARGAEATMGNDVLFVIGSPDSYAWEFGLTGGEGGYAAFLKRFPRPVVYDVGRSSPKDWPYIHPGPKDLWAGGRVHPWAIRFPLTSKQDEPWCLVLGLAGGAPVERSRVVVTVNRTTLLAQTAPAGDPKVAFRTREAGKPETMLFTIPAGTMRQGTNSITLRLEEQSWILYDYVAVRQRAEPLPLVIPPQPDLRAEFREGSMAGVEDIVFAVRKPGEDLHWYANFGSTPGSAHQNLAFAKTLRR